MIVAQETMEKINIAEILRECPQGMELYSPVCGKCEFEGVDDDPKYPITVAVKTDEYFFLADGRYLDLPDAECLLFPSKDQRDWSKFQRPFQYPKTYEKCCEVLALTKAYQSVSGYRTELLEQFQELLICRDAYWKIAGDWKFDFDSKAFYLCNEYKEVKKFSGICDCNAVLAFPTKEMRDVFLENFSDLIDECKEFL